MEYQREAGKVRKKCSLAFLKKFWFSSFEIWGKGGGFLSSLEGEK